jgi:spore coat polysaccharide biosynthesis protein SpsF (cytidylyltransferase family)
MEEFRQLLPSGVRVIQSSPHSAGEDRLSRLREAVESLRGNVPARRPASGPNAGSTRDGSTRAAEGLEGIVMLRLDCPLVDPCLLDRLVNAVREEPWVDYATFHSVRDSVDDRLRALLQTQLGLFVEYFSVEALRKLDDRLTNRAERDRFEGQVSAYSDDFKLRLLALPTALDRGDLRFSLRHQDDWAHAEQIVEALGDERLEWQRLVDLLQRQPEWRDRMASLNRAEYAT